jgi:TRAP-type C4-dicarboxylate transport system permease small subunit
MSKLMETTETRWFKIVSFIIAVIFLGFIIANVVYFNRLRHGTSNAITQAEANSMYWVNVIILIIAILLFLWTLYRLIFTTEFKIVSTAKPVVVTTVKPVVATTVI